MKAVDTIGEVIIQQEAIIEWARINQSPVGYFAVLSQKMTRAVQTAILENQFEDQARMQKLMINFANFYLAAWDNYASKQKTGNAWSQVFMAFENKNLIVLQHLLLGINTHINLDLAKAAVQTCPGDEIYNLQNDFNRINLIIASLMQEVQTCLEKIWWPLHFLTNILNNRQEAILNFSIHKARDSSWANALALSVAPLELSERHIELMETMVTGVGSRIINPSRFTSFILKIVLWMEPKDVAKLIGILRERTVATFKGLTLKSPKDQEFNFYIQTVTAVGRNRSSAPKRIPISLAPAGFHLSPFTFHLSQSHILPLQLSSFKISTFAASISRLSLCIYAERKVRTAKGNTPVNRRLCL